MTYAHTAKRVAIHELGHAAVSVLIYGVTESVHIYKLEDGSYEGQHPPSQQLSGSSPRNRDEWRDVLALFLGGWAAVNLAITRRLIEPAPPGIEAVPGDHGYIGDDKEAVDRFASQSGNHSPDRLIADARQRALDLIAPRIERLVALADRPEGGGMIVADDIENACN